MVPYDNRIIHHRDESGEAELLTLSSADVCIRQSQMAKLSNIVPVDIRIRTTNKVSKYNVAENLIIKNSLMVHQKNHILSKLNSLYLDLDTLFPDIYTIKTLLPVFSHHGWFSILLMYFHKKLDIIMPLWRLFR